MQKEELLNIVRDLRHVQLAVEQAERDNAPGRWMYRGVRAQIATQAAALLGAAVLIAAEYTGRMNPTQFLIQTHFHFSLRYTAIGLIAAVLVLLCSVLYACLFIMARKEGETLENYLSRSLPYLRSVAFLSDLLTKFFALSLVILAGRPDWVAPLLLVFMGDYLLQGRFFALPLRTAYALAAVSIMLGVLQCLLWYGTLLLPLWTLAALSLLSIVHLWDVSRKPAGRS